MQKNYAQFTSRKETKDLSLHYNIDNSYLFVNDVEQLKLKSKVNYLDRNLFTLGNISADWSLQNMENRITWKYLRLQH